MKMRDIASLSVGVDKVGVKNARNTMREKKKNGNKQGSNAAIMLCLCWVSPNFILSRRSEKGHAYHPPQAVNVRQQCKFALLT